MIRATARVGMSVHCAVHNAGKDGTEVESSSRAVVDVKLPEGPLIPDDRKWLVPMEVPNSRFPTQGTYSR